MNYDNDEQRRRFPKFPLILLVILVIISFWLKWPSYFYPNVIKGNLLDVSMNADGTLWILTDATIKVHVNTRGSSRIETFSCKTFMYHYDPVHQKVLQKIKTKTSGYLYDGKLVKAQGQLWQLCRGEETVVISSYNPETGEQTCNSDQFIGRFKDLNSGISEFYFYDNPSRTEFKTKNGLSMVYLIDHNILLKDDYDSVKTKVLTHFRNLKINRLLGFVKSPDESSRQSLYQINDTSEKLFTTYLWPKVETEDISLPYYHDFWMSLNQGKVYLEPFILYQDKELAIFLHQDQVGSESLRFLTCVDTNGHEKWTISSEKLFTHLKLSKKDYYSDKSSLKSRLTGKRQGNIFVIALKESGILGLDLATGTELWRVKTK